jgi:hypothetical protein
VIWLPAGITSAQPAQQAFIDALQTDAALQFGADLVSGDLETAKSAIHTALKPPPHCPPCRRGGPVHWCAMPTTESRSSRSSSCSAAAVLKSACRPSSAMQPRSARPTVSSPSTATPSCFTTAPATKPWKFHQQNDLRKLLGSPASAPSRPA